MAWSPVRSEGHASKAAACFGGLSSWACSWQVLSKRQWEAMQLRTEHVSQQKLWSSGKKVHEGTWAVLHTSVRLHHFCKWKPGDAC